MPNFEMVHAVVLSDDIFPIIFQSLPKKTLATLSRTATVLQGPALRELWRSIDKISHLLRLFGSSVDRHEGKLRFCNAPTLTQWDRFRFYAQHVRILLINSDEDYELSCISILFHHRPLLPHLKTLRVYSWPHRAISSISMFFVASIQQFMIVSHEEDLFVLESLISTLAVTAPGLRNLRITVSPTDREEFGISAPFFQYLSSIDIPLTGFQMHSVLSHLSALPSLSEMGFRISDSAGLSNPGSSSKYLFTAATHLSIESESEEQTLHFLAITQFENLTWLKISCGSHHTDPEPLFTAIPAFCGQFLNTITIYAEDDGSEPAEFSTITPLFNFTNLRRVNLTTELLYWPADEDMSSIARSWPNLEEFYMFPCSNDDFPYSQLTLTGVLYLIEHCTSLKLLSTAVDAEDIPDRASPISRPGLLVVIPARDSPISCPKSVAEFLSFMLPETDFFPAADSSNNCSVWEEAVSLKQYFTRARREGEQRAMEQIQDLQKALSLCHLENARLRSLNN